MIRPVTRREAGWILFDASLPQRALSLSGGEDTAAVLLDVSESLGAGCKVALVGASDLRLRAEQPERPEPDGASQIADVAAGFASAADHSAVARATLSNRAEVSADAPTPEIASLCREAGWRLQERSNGALVVDLEVDSAFVPALVEAQASGIGVEATVVTPLPDTGAGRAALAVLLMRANGAFRMVRAVIRANEGGSEAVLEARLPFDASAVELGLALGAVAVAAQHCAIEAQMLVCDERLARAYLDRWGLGVRPASMSPDETSTLA